MPLPPKRSPQSEIQKPICIVDDDEAVADSLQALLEAFGFKVQSYGSGSECLADKRHRAAGCLLIDQHMPVPAASTSSTICERRGPNPNHADFRAARCQYQAARHPPGRL